MTAAGFPQSRRAVSCHGGDSAAVLGLRRANSLLPVTGPLVFSGYLQQFDYLCCYSSGPEARLLGVPVHRFSL